MGFWNTLRDRSTDLLSDKTDTIQLRNSLTPPINPKLGSSAADPTPTTATPLAAVGDWFSQTFKDLGVANFVRQAYTQDGMLDRFDVINFFRTIEGGGNVTSAEFQDCQTLLQDATSLKIPDYVTVLASKVINPNIANTLFQGSSLGNLQVGSTATQLEYLVDKWFYGSDRPYSVIPALNGHGERSINYQWANGALFGTKNYPSITDVEQGDLGDCFFLTALATTAAHNPAAIQNMFIDNGDGTFTVKLFAEQDGTVGKADYVTVDRYLPGTVFDGGSPQRYAYYDNATVGIWVALAEKAYAQFAEEQLSQRPVSPNGYVYNSYSSIEGGLAYQALPAITGRNAGYYSNYNLGNGRSGNFLPIDQIALGLSNGWSMTVGTVGQSDSTLDPSTGIVMNHEYTIYSADPATGTLWLYNPWGDTSAATGDTNGFKQISYANFAKDGFEIGIG
ncbi:unknown protein [Leptolyngbya sp. NIES-3755]|nr:unknown protein [Leptolyngbya sp. NIES-3755]